MQDEVTKHTQKIFEAVRSLKHSIGEKTKEVITEILIIVFAVTISIWLHSWSEHRHHQKEVREFLADLKEDMNNDISSMQSAKEALSKSHERFIFLQRMDKGKFDSLFRAKSSFSFYSSIGTTKISSGNYEGFKSSGKVGFIEQKELKKLILKYYQDAVPNVIEVEKINASQLMKISDYWADNADLDIKKRILNPKLKSLLATYNGTAKGSLELYKEAITLAKKISTEIDGM